MGNKQAKSRLRLGTIVVYVAAGAAGWQAVHFYHRAQESEQRVEELELQDPDEAFDRHQEQQMRDAERRQQEAQRVREVIDRSP